MFLNSLSYFFSFIAFAFANILSESVYGLFLWCIPLQYFTDYKWLKLETFSSLFVNKSLSYLMTFVWFGAYRNLRIGSSFTFGRIIETTGWSTSFQSHFLNLQVRHQQFLLQHCHLLPWSLLLLHLLFLHLLLTKFLLWCSMVLAQDLFL